MNEQELKKSNEIVFNHVLKSFAQSGFNISDEQSKQLLQLTLSSPYAIQRIILNPNIYMDWYNNQHNKTSFDASQITHLAYQLDADELTIKKFLRQQRHYFLCHIILNDICLGLSTAIILKQISTLATTLINAALDIATEFLASQHATPVNSHGAKQKLMVMAMGKLGGRELNFSSDIDLIFVYAEDGELVGQGNLSYREFYIRVGRLLTKYLNDITEDGFVYRVDLRLRPWGDSGPIVINLSGLENYYQLHGRDWERYALVKARIISGSAVDKQNLQEVITPFVYRKYHDFNVFSGLGNLKQQIDHEAKKKQQALNIKLCSGGIREIEFCMQALQILQGGRHKQLQVTSILSVFERAKAETFYDEVELKTLKDAYLFLRLVENRLQMLADQQTHLLPNDEQQQARLIYSLKMNSWKELLSKIEQTQWQVHIIFKQLFLEHSGQNNVIDFSAYAEDDWQEYCFSLNFKDHKPIAKHLSLFFKERAVLEMTVKGRTRLNELLPSFLSLINEQENSLKVLDLLIGLLVSIARRSVYLEMLSMHQPLLQKLIDLFTKSQWLAEEIIRFPILLEGVLVPHSDDVFDKQMLTNLLRQELKQVAGDVELELDVLRVFKRQQLFYIAVQEIEHKIDALTASYYLSELASIMLQLSYELNFKTMLEQYGMPQYVDAGETHNAHFAIIAYGKLGGQELHYTSDLDVIFVHDSHAEKQWTNADKCIDNTQFFIRLAQKITQTMGLRTSSGRIYEIDTRLRPNGASGFLVTTLDAYYQYQSNKAWVWEHQALLRASYVAGHDSMRQQFNTLKCKVLKNIKKTNNLNTEISSMREKMYQALKATANFNIKQSKGGMVDIEFIVQYFVLLNANKLSSLCEYSANIALLKCLHKHNCIDVQYLELIPIYASLHRRLHQQVLQPSSAALLDEKFNKDIETVSNLWAQCFTLV